MPHQDLATAIQARVSLPVLPLKPVETRWAVITGAWSSGKTTLIDELVRQLPEAHVLKDAGRAVIERGLAWSNRNQNTLALEHILRTSLFEHTLFAEKWSAHHGTDPERVCLLDYALPDVVAFSRLCEVDTSLFATRAGLFRYAAVFILDPLPYKEDYARKWDEDERQKIHQCITAQYKALGFTPIHVPVKSVEERAEIVLSEMRRLKLT